MRTEQLLDLIAATLPDDDLSPDAARYAPPAPATDGMPALLLRPDGTVQDVTLPHGSQLAAKRRALDCRLIDCVAVTPQLDMWIDDEGADTGQLPNEPAAIVAAILGRPGTRIFGPVLCTGGPDANGDTTPLTAALATAIRETAAALRGLDDDQDDDTPAI